MQYFIKEWTDRTASIYAEDGYLLETFASVQEAILACRNDCLVEPMRVESPYLELESRNLQSSPLDFEHSFVDAA